MEKFFISEEKKFYRIGYSGDAKKAQFYQHIYDQLLLL